MGVKSILTDLEKELGASLKRARKAGHTGAIQAAVEEWCLMVSESLRLKRHQFAKLRRLVKQQPNDEVAQLMTRLVSHLNAYEWDQNSVKNAAKYEQLASVSSFRACLTLRSRRKLLAGGASCPEWAIENKIKAFKFAELAGVKSPWQSKVFSIDRAEFVRGRVYKPTAGAGARGVYLAFDENRIFDVSRAITHDNWASAYESMLADVKDGRVSTRHWLMEELVTDSRNAGSLPRDMKFLCFYGKAMLVREFTRYPERAAASWDAAGVAVKDGLEGEAPPIDSPVSPEKACYELAERLSLEIPTPFMRIDFMTSDDGLILNEFTPRPGTYTKFNTEWDRCLGDAFLEAEARLQNDLLMGKSFDVYKKFLTKYC